MDRERNAGNLRTQTLHDDDGKYILMKVGSRRPGSEIDFRGVTPWVSKMFQVRHQSFIPRRVRAVGWKSENYAWPAALPECSAID